MDCIFCKIINGEIPSHKIYEDEKTFAFLDIAPGCAGHTLVIPKKHCVNMLDCSDTYLQATIKSVKKIAKHYVDDCGFGGVDVLNANGECAQQTVFHLHFHIAPRKQGDGLDLWALKEQYQLDLKDICDKLKMC